MHCDIVKDLIPLYIDDCCSKQSELAIAKHIQECETCKKLLNEMRSPSDIVAAPPAPQTFSKLNDWKASLLQSVLLFFSFALITIGVALEAKTPSGLMNGFWALNLVIPATGFMLSLANWYFVRVYANRKRFSDCSFLATLIITVSAYVWSGFHYGLNLFELFAGCGLVDILEALHTLSFIYGLGILLTIVFCVLSKILSDQYAKMLGKM